MPLEGEALRKKWLPWLVQMARKLAVSQTADRVVGDFLMEAFVEGREITVRIKRSDSVEWQFAYILESDMPYRHPAEGEFMSILTVVYDLVSARFEIAGQIPEPK